MRYLRTTGRLLGVGAAVAALVLMGCGATEEESGKPGIDESAKEITIGAFGPVTGNPIYKDELSAADAYFKMVNDQGGLDGWKIRYVTRDDQYDPTKTPLAARQLVERDNIFAFINAVGTTQIQAVLPFIEDTGIPFVAPAAGRDLFAEAGFMENVFPAGPSFRDEGQLLARYAIEQLGARRLGLFYRDDAVGQPSVPGYEQAISEAGAEDVAQISHPVTTTDFTPYAKRLKSSGAEAVVVFAGPDGVAGLQKAARAIGYNPEWLAVWFAATDQFSKLGGQEGTYFDAWLTPLAADTEAVQTYKQAMEKYQPNAALGSVSQQGWVDAAIGVEALRRTLERDGEFTRDGLIEALETFQDVDVGMAKGITYTSESHLGVTNESIVQLRDGEFEIIAEDVSLEASSP